MSQTVGASEQWKQAVFRYAKYINDYVAQGDACDWKGMGDAKGPPDLQALLPELMVQLRAANALGTPQALASFREQWPPLHEATQPLLEGNSQGIGSLAWLPNGDLLVRAGTWYEPGQVVCLRDLKSMGMPGVENFGMSPRQQALAMVGKGEISVLRSQDLSVLATYPLPKGDEGLPPGYPSGAEDEDDDPLKPGATSVQQIIPFDDGSGVVLVQSEGVFLIRAGQIQRLLPEAQELQEAMEEGDPYPVRLDMCHAAISPDGSLIACGEQDGRHRIFNAQGELMDRIGPHGEYPHHAAFFADGQHVALNACHFYNGATIAVNVQALGNIDTDFYEEHEAVTEVHGSARVYASAPVGDALVLGDASGYLWVRNPQGEQRWKQHVGSTISAMAVSANGQLLAVGTYSGMVHIIDLANTEAAPEQVGVGARRELRRWLFWKQEQCPLAW